MSEGIFYYDGDMTYRQPVRDYDDADDLQEREQFLKDQGVDHEELLCCDCGKEECECFG